MAVFTLELYILWNYKSEDLSDLREVINEIFIKIQLLCPITVIFSEIDNHYFLRFSWMV